MIDVVLFGAGGMTQAIYSYIKDDVGCGLHVSGFCVDAEYHDVDELFGLPVVSFNEVQGHFSPKQYKMLPAIGYHEMNRVRADRSARAEEKGYELASYVHSQASVSSTASLGRGCILFPGVVIEPFATVGHGNIFWSNSVLCHHNTVGDFNFFASNSSIAGHAVIGDRCFIGMCAQIKERVYLHDEVCVGAGTFISEDVNNNCVVVSERAHMLGISSLDLNFSKATKKT